MHINSQKKIVMALAAGGFLLASCGGASSSGSSNNNGGASQITANDITIDKAGTIPVFNGSSTKSVIYVHNSGKITISRINFSVKSNVSANSQVTNSQRLQSAGLADSAQFTIDASQCTSIPAGQSCPIGFITPTVDSKHAQGSAVIQATFADSKNKIYTTSGVLNYSRVADKGQNGAVIHSGVSMTAAANATQAYGTVYVYGSGDGHIYNVNKLALDNPALKISQGDINGRQLQSHFVQAVELSSPVNSSQSVKSNSKLTTAAKSLNSVINGNLNAQSSDSQSGASYLSTVGVSASPFSDGAILTTGIMCIRRNQVHQEAIS